MCGGKHNQLVSGCWLKNLPTSSSPSYLSPKEAKICTVWQNSALLLWTAIRLQRVRRHAVSPATGPLYKTDHLESSKSFGQSLLVGIGGIHYYHQLRSSGLGHGISVYIGRGMAWSWLRNLSQHASNTLTTISERWWCPLMWCSYRPHMYNGTLPHIILYWLAAMPWQ